MKGPGKLSVEYLDDPLEQWLGYRLSEDDVIGLIKDRVWDWERAVTGEIIVPTSGGYDSRLLNWCIEDKSRVRSFTYGISENRPNLMKLCTPGDCRKSWAPGGSKYP